MLGGVRIGYLIQQFPPEIGAGAARASEMALRWTRSGAAVTVITGMPNRPSGRVHPDYRGRVFMTEDWQGISILRSWLYATPRPGTINTVANNASFLVTGLLHALARARAIDVLIASSPPFFPHVSGTLAARALRIPLVLEVRDLWPDYLVDMGMLRAESTTARGLFALERRLLRRANGVAVVTDSFRRRVEAKGVAPERIRVLPNGVDLDFYARGNAGAPPVPALVRKDREFVIGYMGNFGAGQDIPLILDAFRAALATGLNARLVITGDGPQRDRIARRIGELALGAAVALTPPVAKPETVAFYTACDACIVPLAAVPVFQETVPSKIFEVMACETPVVGCFSGEAARIVEESGAGIVAPPGNTAAIADAIVSMARLPAEARAAMGARGRRFVSLNYNRDTVAAGYLEFLAGIAAGPGRS
jgi:colanic acid biosynthesis glycosyl transferase WcaI